MKRYWVKTNWFVKKIFKNYVWDIPNEENKIYLTFDDGPTPIITEWVLEELKKHQAKATFFCVGKNIKKNPALFLKIISEGHSIGNHTNNHLNGWTTTTNDYLQNIELCTTEIKKFESISISKASKLFRPPYGKIKKSQSKRLQKSGYKIVMWDILTADFDTTITPEKCLENSLKNVTTGSIIVFHDSEKAYKNLAHALPKSLQILKEKGFKFEAL